MAVETYSRTQIILHWTVVVLVLFQILFHDEIVRLWDGRMDGTIVNEPTPQLHAVVGIAIFVLMAWRLVLRLNRGVPAPPAGEHRALKLAASTTHFLLYALLLGMPISGLVAWVFGIEQAAQAHSAARLVLILIIALHFAAALAQHFWFKTDVLRRMLGRT